MPCIETECNSYLSYQHDRIGLLIVYMVINLAISCMGYTVDILKGEKFYISLHKPILVMTFASLGCYFNLKLMKM